MDPCGVERWRAVRAGGVAECIEVFGDLRVSRVERFDKHSMVEGFEAQSRTQIGRGLRIDGDRKSPAIPVRRNEITLRGRGGATGREGIRDISIRCSTTCTGFASVVTRIRHKIVPQGAHFADRLVLM